MEHQHKATFEAELEGVEDAGDQLNLLTRKSMAESGETNFQVAFMRVCAVHPKLHREYLDSNGVKSQFA